MTVIKSALVKGAASVFVPPIKAPSVKEQAITEPSVKEQTTPLNHEAPLTSSQSNSSQSNSSQTQRSQANSGLKAYLASLSAQEKQQLLYTEFAEEIDHLKASLKASLTEEIRESLTAEVQAQMHEARENQESQAIQEAQEQAYQEAKAEAQAEYQAQIQQAKVELSEIIAQWQSMLQSDDAVGQWQIQEPEHLVMVFTHALEKALPVALLQPNYVEQLLADVTAKYARHRPKVLYLSSAQYEQYQSVIQSESTNSSSITVKVDDSLALGSYRLALESGDIQYHLEQVIAQLLHTLQNGLAPASAKSEGASL